MDNLATVIQGMQRKDKESFRLMVNHYAPRLMTVAKFYAKNSQDAEDILQDAFVLIFLNIKKFHYTEEQMFIGWAKRIVVNTALSKYRRRYFSHEKYPDILTDKGTTAQADLQHDEDNIMASIYQLPLKYREVLGLYALEGYSHADISKMLRIKESSSRSIYSRAKSKLKKIMNVTKVIIC